MPLGAGQGAQPLSQLDKARATFTSRYVTWQVLQLRHKARNIGHAKAVVKRLKHQLVIG